MTGLEGLADLARQAWREDAACDVRDGREWVDPEPADVDDLLRICRHCPVVAPCREQGDAEAPHRHPVVQGARFYGKGEPRDGWQVGAA